MLRFLGFLLGWLVSFMPLARILSGEPFSRRSPPEARGYAKQVEIIVSLRPERTLLPRVSKSPSESLNILSGRRPVRLRRGQSCARGALGLLGLPRTHLRQVRSRYGHRPTPSSCKSRIHIMYKADIIKLVSYLGRKNNPPCQPPNLQLCASGRPPAVAQLQQRRAP